MFFTVSAIIGGILTVIALITMVLGILDPEDFLAPGLIGVLIGGLQCGFAEQKMLVPTIVVDSIELIIVAIVVAMIMRELLPAKRHWEVLVRDPNGGANYFSIGITDGDVEDVGYNSGAIITNATFVSYGSTLYVSPEAIKDKDSLRQRLKIYGIRGVKLP